LPFGLRPRFLFVPDVPETRLADSTLGERENLWSCEEFSGGKDVWRSGCEEVDVMESMDALRRLAEGAVDGMSDCRLLGA
jgi:hypothetical protein